MIERDWHVLLVGGPSGAGKSAACATLMRRYGLGCAEIDDMVAAARAMTTSDQQPALHYWTDNAANREWTAEQLLETTLRTARAFQPAIQAVVDAHLDNGPPVILEGDCLLPEVLAQPPLTRPEVRAVFLYELDEEQLVANFDGREPDAGAQRMRARVSRMFGEWLRDEGIRCGVPALPVRPWDTIADRIAAAAAAAGRQPL